MPVLRPTAQGDLDEFVASAAVLLTRRAPGGRELFLVERSPRLSFFPGHWALPGGRLDPEDGDHRDPSLMAYRRCAVRELFEEVGVLAPGLELEPREREVLRRGLNADRGRGEAAATARWRELVDAAQASTARLEPVCWTTTPDFTRRRYRALYLHLECPPGERPLVEDGELVGGSWWEPRELLSTWERGGMRIVPPLVYLAQALRAAEGDWERAMAACGARSREVDEGALHVVSPAPGVDLAPLRTRTLPPARTTNCYVIGGRWRYVVDPATHDEEERERLLARLEHEGDRLAGVLVTHHHPDHVGSVEHVARRFGIPVLAHPLTLERLPRAPGDSRPIGEGDRLPLGVAPDGTADWCLRVLHTPGHARGHLCFLDECYRTLVAGDLVATLSTIVIDPPEGHLATYLEQLERMRALEPGVVLPAHGPAAPDGAGLLTAFLRHRAQREARLVAALAGGAQRPLAELLAEVYEDTPAPLLPLAERSLLAGLEKLVEEGRARRGPGEAWSGGP